VVNTSRTYCDFWDAGRLEMLKPVVHFCFVLTIPRQWYTGLSRERFRYF